MARHSQINYKRITLSFPAKVVNKLRQKVGQNKMSSYVSGLVEKDLDRELKQEAKEFVEGLKEFRKNVVMATDKDSLTLLREIRYGS